MKNTTLLMTGLIVNALSAVAFAGPVISGGGIGDTKKYLSCNGESGASFVVRGTAVPTFKQGVLEIPGQDAVTFKCQPQNTKIAPKAPSAGRVIAVCTEYPAPREGAYSVRVTQGGVTGKTIAYVAQAQVYPLPPQVVETLICK
jgi:hypothetical protein